MGRPKGLVCFPGCKQTFLEMIVSLYQGVGWPGAIIIKPEDELVYGPLLNSLPSLRIIREQGGQDTAQSVLASWKKLSGQATHLWVHPVDMPLLEQETLDRLLEESKNKPQCIIRPVYQSKPGHPVIMSAHCLNILTRENNGPPWPSGPVRRIVEKAVLKNLLEPVCEVIVGDKGVITDFDTISALEDNFPKSPQEGNEP